MYCDEVHFNCNYPNDPETLEFLSSLSEQQTKIGSHGDAILLQEEYLSIMQQLYVFDKYDVDIAVVRHILAYALYYGGKISQAESNFCLSFDVCGRLPENPKGHTSTIIGFKFVKPELDFYFNIVKLHIRLFPSGFEHESFARVLQELGYCRRNEAEFWFEKSLQMKRRLFQNIDLESISSTLYSLANVAQKKQLLDRAEGLFQNSLNMDERICSRDHKTIVTTLRSISELQEKKGCLERAERSFLRVFWHVSKTRMRQIL